ncbi:MAG: DUF3857 domain-containing protein [Bacteroidales bacterium]|nr:DUF3857 domain-containing protein [Candidatus Latescibacterota bacterium]
MNKVLATTFLLISVSLFLCHNNNALASGEHDKLCSIQLTDEQSKADAVVILDAEHLEVEKSDKSWLEYRIVKKILRTRRADEGIFSFPDNKYRRVVSIDARAIHPGGDEERLSIKDVPRVPEFRDFVMYSDQQSRLIRFEGTRRGTIIDITIRWKIKHPVFWPPSIFQSHIPILKKTFTLTHKKNLHVRVSALSMTAAPDTTFTPGSDRIRQEWSRTNIDPLEMESMMPPLQQYLPFLLLSMSDVKELGADLDLSAWNGIARWYDGLSRGRMKPGSKTRDILRDLALNGLSERDRARKIYCYVSNSVRYVAIYLGLGGFQPHSAEETAENLYGDCKDQATLLTVLLREAGIEAYPVLVRTRDLGRLPDISPYPGYFNHAITAVVINGEIIYLDPTCSVCSFGVLPSTLQGSDALMVGGSDKSIIQLSHGPGTDNTLRITGSVTLNESGEARVEDKFECAGLFAEIYRSLFSRSSGQPPEERCRRILPGNHPFLNVEEVDLAGRESSAPEMIMDVIYTVPGFMKNKKTVFLDAILHKLSISLPAEEDRVFPIDMGKPKINSYKLDLYLPPSRMVEAIPAPVEISCEHFDYSGIWKITRSSIEFQREFKIKNNIVPVPEIPEIRNLLKKIKKFENCKLLIIDTH